MPPDPTGGPIIREVTLRQRIQKLAGRLGLLNNFRLVLVLIGLSVYGFNLFRQASPSTSPSPTPARRAANAPATTADKPKLLTVPAVAQGQNSDGNTGCYSLTPPAGAATRTVDSCGLIISYGNPQSVLNIRSMTGNKGNLQEYVDEWKATARHNSDTILSQNIVNVGSRSAARLTFVYHNDVRVQAIWIIYTGSGTLYKLPDYTTENFIIFGDYQTPKEFEAVDSLIASITWK